MFIQSRKALKFKGPGGEVFTVPARFVGEVPEWVTETRLFHWAAKDGSITMPISSRDKAVEQAAQTADEMRAAVDRKKAEALENARASKEAKAKEKAEAEAKAKAEAEAQTGGDPSPTE